MSEWAYVGGCSHLGTKHKENQDAWYGSKSRALDERGALVIVCDGVGSTEEGGWAADIACLRMRELYLSQEELSKDVFIRCILEIDWELRGKGRGKAACTMVLLWIYQGEALLLGLGDSEICLLRDQSSHSFFVHKKRSHQLRKFIGMGEGLADCIMEHRLPLRKDDVFFLMTDGVAEYVDQHEFYTLWTNSYQDPELCAERFVQLAEACGSADDNTVVVVHYHLQ